MKASLDIEDIKKLLPHRFPFLMIDRVTEIGPERVVSLKNVSVGEHFLVGHFPDLKVMPGVLIVEAMAQTGIILYKQKYQNDAILFLMSEKSRFYHPVFPGDQLKIIVTPLKMLSKMGLFKAEAFVDEKKVAESEIAFGTKDAKTEK